MKDITQKEMEAVLTLVKSPEEIYNANSLAKVLDITSMGALKILKRLEKEGIVKARQIGKATTYKISQSDYAQHYITLLLSRELLQAESFVKRWVNEIKKLKSVQIAVLFGSVLRKKEVEDIDVLLVTDQKNFPKLKKEIEELNKINIKRIHPMYQSFEDVIKNIKERDKPLLNAIKGMVVLGEEKFLEVYHESC